MSKVPTPAVDRGTQGPRDRQASDLVPELTCPGCGVTFVPRVWNQKWCSRRCQERAAAAKWQAANPEYIAKWRAANPEKVRAADRERKRKHDTEEVRERKRTWNAANPEKTREYRRAWWVANPEKQRESEARWRAANPEKVRDIQRNAARKRQAAKRGVPSEPYSLSEIFTRDKGICQLCRRKVNLRWKAPNRRAASIDHLIPVSRGGHDTRDNIQLAHLGCNIAKQARTMPTGEQLRLVG